jgi:hypothetical protein
MASENQALLDAIRVIVAEAVEPLIGRMDGFDRRMDGFDGRMDGFDGRMDGFDGRMDGFDGRMARLEQHVETIDTRTSQMAIDLLDLRDRVPLLEERVDNGFRALKSDLNFAFSDAQGRHCTAKLREGY